MLYRDNPRWADLAPVAQDDGPHPVVPIMYDAEFVDCMDTFRAVLKRDEVSERAFELTEDVIGHNAANYSAWHFRRKCLFALGKDLGSELKFLEEIALQSPKNYQLWHHRRVIVDAVNHVGRELEHTAQVLLPDAKNYHTWSHRQWVLARFYADGHKQWQEELKYVESLLDHDVRNNSAWSQRHYVVSHELALKSKDDANKNDNNNNDNNNSSSSSSSADDGKEDDVVDSDTAGNAKATDTVAPASPGAGVAWHDAATIQRELDFATAQLKRAINNESVWNYIRGLSYKPGFTQKHLDQVEQLCTSYADHDTCVPAMGLLVDLYGRPFPGQQGHKDWIDSPCAKLFTAVSSQVREQRLAKARSMCDSLCKHDAIRSSFWAYQKESLKL
eukprot:TRINITY_DN3437_c0_g1_i1.p1 TRINITY_DN3437_c0_g1~~TRINITY_DN3437_c0_g1_i1.p1  ORF type:complete len:388 (-),score=172.97 TRINITY_DN3437_c0_g1_i1:41-1204(-)